MMSLSFQQEFDEDESVYEPETKQYPSDKKYIAVFSH